MPGWGAFNAAVRRYGDEGRVWEIHFATSDDELTNDRNGLGLILEIMLRTSGLLEEWDVATFSYDGAPGVYEFANVVPVNIADYGQAGCAKIYELGRTGHVSEGDLGFFVRDLVSRDILPSGDYRVVVD